MARPSVAPWSIPKDASAQTNLKKKPPVKSGKEVEEEDGAIVQNDDEEEEEEEEYDSDPEPEAEVRSKKSRPKQSTLNRRIFIRRALLDHISAGDVWTRPDIKTSRCKEDVTDAKYEPSRSIKLWEHVVSCKRPPSTDVRRPDFESWKDVFEKNKPLSLIPPRSKVNYHNRLRTKRLRFTVYRNQNECIIKSGEPSPLFSTFDREAIEKTLFECTDGECHHMVVPIRTRLERYRVQGAPDVSLTFQLVSDEFRLTEDEKRSVRSWLPPQTYESISKSMTADKKEQIRTFATGYPLEFNVDRDYSDYPRLLFKNDPYLVNPDLYDWLSVLHLGTGYMRTKYTIPSGSLSSVKIRVPQPNPKTNVSPNLLSHFVTHAVRARNNGSSAQILQANTVTVNGVNCWNLDKSVYESIESQLLATYSKRRVVMNLENGLTASFNPVDAALWNAGLKSDIYISVTVLLDYVVIGKKGAF